MATNDAKKKNIDLLSATKDMNSKTLDSFTNYVSKIGLPADNLLNAANYSLDYSTRNRLFLEASYRSNWVIQQVVSVVAEDMTREGATIECSKLSTKEHTIIEDTIDNLMIWEKLTDAIRWSRLFGTCAAIPLIDGQNLESELDPDTIGPGQFKGITTADRWRLLPSIGEPITDYGPFLGLPKFYKTTSDIVGIPDQVIHYSRAWRFDCIELPYYQALAESSFGESIIEVIRDRIVAFDSVTMGVASLVFKAHLRTMKIQGLREIMAGNQDAARGLAASLDQLRAWQTNNGLSVIDSEDEFQLDSYSFGGLGDVMDKFMEQISGATQIPMVRLFGTSPGGLNADGASALSSYYDHIRRLQERQLRKPLRKIIDLICRSELGKPLPADFRITFKPLWQNSDSGKSDIAAKTVDSMIKAYEAGLISQHQALRELNQVSGVTGIFTTLSEKEINEAETEIPDLAELMGGGLEEQDVGSAKPAPSKEAKPKEAKPKEAAKAEKVDVKPVKKKSKDAAPEVEDAVEEA